MGLSKHTKSPVSPVLLSPKKIIKSPVPPVLLSQKKYMKPPVSPVLLSEAMHEERDGSRGAKKGEGCATKLLRSLPC